MVSQKLLILLWLLVFAFFAVLDGLRKRDRRASWPVLRKPRKWWRLVTGKCIGDLLGNVSLMDRSSKPVVLASCSLDANHPGGCMDTRKGKYWTKHEPPVDFVAFPLWPKDWDAPYIVAWRLLWIIPVLAATGLHVALVFCMHGRSAARDVWRWSN